jgi:hypothetical protein
VRHGKLCCTLLYFYDTGLGGSLLNIEKESQRENFYMRGNLAGVRPSSPQRASAPLCETSGFLCAKLCAKLFTQRGWEVSQRGAEHFRCNNPDKLCFALPRLHRRSGSSFSLSPPPHIGY